MKTDESEAVEEEIAEEQVCVCIFTIVLCYVTDNP